VQYVQPAPITYVTRQREPEIRYVVQQPQPETRYAVVQSPPAPSRPTYTIRQQSSDEYADTNADYKFGYQSK
jgi:hypothetical protein